MHSEELPTQMNLGTHIGQHSAMPILDRSDFQSTADLPTSLGRPNIVIATMKLIPDQRRPPRRADLSRQWRGERSARQAAAAERLSDHAAGEN
jgi:hypothetical protein